MKNAYQNNLLNIDVYLDLMKSINMFVFDKKFFFSLEM